MDFGGTNFSNNYIIIFFIFTTGLPDSHTEFLNHGLAKKLYICFNIVRSEINY